MSSQGRGWVPGGEEWGAARAAQDLLHEPPTDLSQQKGWFPSRPAQYRKHGLGLRLGFQRSAKRGLSGLLLRLNSRGSGNPVARGPASGSRSRGTPDTTGATERRKEAKTSDRQSHGTRARDRDRLQRRGRLRRDHDPPADLDDKAPQEPGRREARRPHLRLDHRSTLPRAGEACLGADKETSGGGADRRGEGSPSREAELDETDLDKRRGTTRCGPRHRVASDLHSNRWST
jgi:hypothetical protein